MCFAACSGSELYCVYLYIGYNNLIWICFQGNISLSLYYSFIYLILLLNRGILTNDLIQKDTKCCALSPRKSFLTCFSVKRIEFQDKKSKAHLTVVVWFCHLLLLVFLTNLLLQISGFFSSAFCFWASGSSTDLWEGWSTYFGTNQNVKARRPTYLFDPYGCLKCRFCVVKRELLIFVLELFFSIFWFDISGLHLHTAYHSGVLPGH